MCRAASMAARTSGSVGSRRAPISMAVSASSTGKPKPRNRLMASTYWGIDSRARPPRVVRPALMEVRRASTHGPCITVASSAAKSVVAASASRDMSAA